PRSPKSPPARSQTTQSPKKGPRSTARPASLGCPARPSPPAGAATSNPPKTPLPLLVVDEGLQEVNPAKLRPVNWGKPNLSVSQLPKEEVADPGLPTRPDQKVRIGHAPGVHLAREPLLVDVVFDEVAPPGLGHRALYHIDDLGPAAVVETHIEDELVVGHGEPLSGFDLFHQGRRQR